MMSKYFILLTLNHPLGISKLWICHSTYIHPSRNSYNIKLFHFINTHPSIEHIQGVTLSVYIHCHKPLWSQNLLFYEHPPTHHKYTRHNSVTVYSSTHKLLWCQTISFYEHPRTNWTHTRYHSVSVYSPTYKQLQCHLTKPLYILEYSENQEFQAFIRPRSLHPVPHETNKKFRVQNTFPWIAFIHFRHL